MLNHLTAVSMPRGSTTQTRTFNYANGNTIGTLLLSATNPENGTVSYTYDSYKRLATKTDAKGQVFTYTYDGFNRLTQISVGGNVLRTYVYDSNIDNPSYSQNVAGRLAEIKYPGIGFVDYNGNSATTQFTDMFSYAAPGTIAGKLLSVTKTGQVQNINTHQWNPQTATGSINVAYAYNAEGKLTNVTYPTDINNNTPSFAYSYDAMMRLASMSDWETSSYVQPVVNGVIYNAANQITAINYYQQSETRTYNSLMQLTNITTNPPSNQTVLNFTYNYTNGQNNGKIASTSDAISGETVTYQYDSLNRLISASGSTNGSTTWSQAQSYDGFGNLTARTGTGAAQSTTINTPVNPATNQLNGYSYDANGNLLSTGNSYDPENRLIVANLGGLNQLPAAVYSYDGQNKRIWRGTCTITPSNCTTNMVDTEVVSLFGADGKLLANFGISMTGTSVTFGYSAIRAYFGGKLVAQLGSAGFMTAAVQDRLGSVGKYYPYGEDRTGQPGSDTVRFATYTRDSATGNDYADQRYYSSVLGRFMTPDPYQASAKGISNPTNPQSWNRYVYGGSDPLNHNDPSGNDYCDEEDLFCLAGGDSGITIDGVIVDWSQFAALIAAQVQAALSSPEGQTSLQLIPLYEEGFVNDWSFTNGALSNLDVNWDNVFGFLATAPFPLPAGGVWSWDEILSVLRANPLTLLLAAMLVQTGGSGPPNFPKERCPKPANFNDPTKSPGQGWEWRGNGPVGSSQGSWYNPITHESLHPDLGHGDPIGPHWDYTDPTGQVWRCFPDGSYSKK